MASLCRNLKIKYEKDLFVTRTFSKKKNARNEPRSGQLLKNYIEQNSNDVRIMPASCREAVKGFEK